MTRRRTLTVSLVLALAAGCTAAVVTGSGAWAPEIDSAPHPRAPLPAQPNIVLVLVDDMASNLLQYMRATNELAEESVVFDNFFTSSPLCCPSRATIQTGKYPHNTGVLSNWWPVGGFAKFRERHLTTSLAPYLDDTGYRTALMGKYLNEYLPNGDTDGRGAPDYPPAYVPPGWDEWFVSGNDAYGNFEYEVAEGLNGDSKIVRFRGETESDYLTDVLAARAESFVEHASDGTEPFFLMVAPFAVHASSPTGDPQPAVGYRYPPAPRDRAAAPDRPVSWGAPEFAGGDCGDPVDGGCADVTFPDPASAGSFNMLIEDAPRWAPKSRLDSATLARVRQSYIERVQMIQSVDDLVKRIWDALEDAGVADSTYLFFTADNGFHLGEHAIGAGKSTAYDHDVRIPLIVRPPGGLTETRASQIVQNTDLLPTFLEIAGAAVPSDVDGVSVLDLIHDRPPPEWRAGALIEYDAYLPGAGSSEPAPGLPPSYHALRAEHYLYVDYSSLDSAPPDPFGGELYDVTSDPGMLTNLWPGLTVEQRRPFNDEMLTLVDCRGDECWGRLLEVPPLP